MKNVFQTPIDISKKLASNLKALRLEKRWKRTTLADRAGVTESTLRRFEVSGKISMGNFLKLLHALGRLDEMDAILNPSTVNSIAELEKQVKKTPKRGSV